MFFAAQDTGSKGKALRDTTTVGKGQQTRTDSNIPSTSKNVFVKPTVPEPPCVSLDKGNEVIEGDVPISVKDTQKPPIIKRPPLWVKWPHPTSVLPSQSSEIKGQERVARTSCIRH